MSTARKVGDLRIGVSGWTYAPWRGGFYPEGVPRKGELAYASRQFSSLEVNGTFYGLQKPDVFARWRDSTPDDFIFAVKGPRYITHILRLRDSTQPLANFFASGVLRLGKKLGPILWQLPPNLPFDADLLEAFLSRLPFDGAAASKLARKHDGKLRHRAWARVDSMGTIRHALEIRHESFIEARFIRLLRQYGVALVCADTVKWPRLMNLTSDFVYCRLHGSRVLYQSAYRQDEIQQWATRIQAWRTGAPNTNGDFAPGPVGRPKRRDVFVFFDNTDKKHAPADARKLRSLLNPERGDSGLE